MTVGLALVVPMTDTYLRLILSDIAAANREAERLVDGLSEEELNRAPEPGAWSVAQCLDHLARTAAQYRTRLEPAIARGRLHPLASMPFYEPTWIGRWITDTLRSSERRFRSPRAFAVPAHPAPGALDRFLAEQQALAALAHEADGIDLNRTRFSSPTNPLLRFSVGDAFALMTAHVERHLRQARRVRERLATGH
jgi:hypothetical protein